MAVAGAAATPEPAAPADGDVVFASDRQSAAGVGRVVVTPGPLAARVWRAGRVAVHDDRVAHACPPAEGIVRDAPARLGLAAERESAARPRTTSANAGELLKRLAADTPLADIEKRLADRPIGDWRQPLLGAYTRRKQLRTQLAAQQAAGGSIPESTVLKTQAEADAAGAAYTALAEDLRFQVRNQVLQAELKLKDAETLVDVARAKLLLYGLTPDAIDRLDPVAEGAAASRLTLNGSPSPRS